MKNKTDKTDAELLDLGKKLQQFYNSGYVNKKQTFLFSFYKGLATGVGVFLGGTVVIALVIWILSFFSQIPFANHVVHELKQANATRK